MVVFFIMFSCMQHIILKEQKGVFAAYRIEVARGI
jgi:hypothetical protein